MERLYMVLADPYENLVIPSKSSVRGDLRITQAGAPRAIWLDRNAAIAVAEVLARKTGLTYYILETTEYVEEPKAPLVRVKL